MSGHRITFVGPPTLALQVVTELAEADGVDLTASHPPAPHGQGMVTLDVTVEASTAAVAAAIGRIRTGLPAGASLDINAG